jgi:hypothetical protein
MCLIPVFASLGSDLELYRKAYGILHLFNKYFFGKIGFVLTYLEQKLIMYLQEEL